MSLADLIIVREKFSAENLIEIGIIGSIITADLAFLYEKPVERKRNGVVLITKSEGPEIINLIQPGKEITIIPTDMSDIENAKLIQKFHNVKIKIIKKPEEFIEAISNFEFAISTRMHGAIFASIAGTPFVAISDDFKFKGVIGELCENCVISYDEKCREKIKEIFENKKYLNLVNENLPKIRKKAFLNKTILKEKIKSWNI